MAWMSNFAAAAQKFFRAEPHVWGTALSVITVIGLALLLLVGFMNKGVVGAVDAFFMGLACLVVGALIGFLFGIPRSLQAPDASGDSDVQADDKISQDLQPSVKYIANTNLEQISDWLTKILVGIGLTQLNQLSDKIDRMGVYFAGVMTNDGDSGRMAVPVIVFFTISGFMYAYLWTRIFLGGELVKADLGAMSQSLKAVSESVTEVKEAQQEQERQALNDARALSLFNKYISGDKGNDVDMGALREAMRRSSPPIKVQIFYQASRLRSNSWRQPRDRWKVGLTVPIFEALIASDDKNEFHQNYGQLGFALKDMVKPDYDHAIRALDEAIALRGPASENGWHLYEFNRAICMISLDADFVDGRPSDEAVKLKIKRDLAVAARQIKDLHEEKVILDWLKLNGVASVAEL